MVARILDHPHRAAIVRVQLIAVQRNALAAGDPALIPDHAAIRVRTYLVRLNIGLTKSGAKCRRPSHRAAAEGWQRDEYSRPKICSTIDRVSLTASGRLAWKLRHGSAVSG